GLPQHGRLLAVLGAALLSPLPSVVRERTAFLEPTAAAAEVLVQLAGTPVAREGVLLFVDGGTVEVTPLCSGLKLAGQLGVLALLLLCLFRTTARQKVGVVLAAVFVGFLVNTGRVAFLTLVAAHAQDDFVFWDGDGLGSNVFPLVGTLLAASAWWLLLGGVRGLRAASGGPQPPTVARYTTPSPSSP
ncbi:MAG: exosortase/archaeosortase family protein, partial [Myxococcaceae bacterium]|nr:exosortase/archaeosortase family protein [Myxococcaceae bacterium]